MNAAADEVLNDVNDIEGVINYTVNSGVRPINYTYEPPAGVPRNSGVVDARVVRIRNARLERGLGLDISGFELVTHRSTLTEWASFQDHKRVENVYYPEVERKLKLLTGADKVVIFDHTIRDSSVPAGQATLRDPVRRVHDDQTLRSAPARVHRHLPAEEAARRLQRRFAIVNFWRPVAGPVRQAPLAVCDARSISMDDMLPSDLVYPEWTGETYAVAFNPRHRWHWYPYQQPWEATLLKIYDSATDGRARLTAHTAFDLPVTDALIPPRRSIETRVMLFW